MVLSRFKNEIGLPGGGGACLQSQHLGDRGRRISEARLVYRESSRTTQAAQRNPISKTTKTNKQKTSNKQKMKLENSEMKSVQRG